MAPAITDQVVDFYYEVFEHIFAKPFRLDIRDRLRRDDVLRKVEEAAGAASQSLVRFFLNEQLTEQQTTHVLHGFHTLPDRLTLKDIANPRVTPEESVAALLLDLPCPAAVQRAKQDAVYRVALHSIVQVLMLVGPVMAEWQKLNFASTFELPRRVINRLNQISAQLDTLGRSGQAAADERYELTYRDYLLQRFHRVEAGTVRMTTNLDVDLRELFVVPHGLVRPRRKEADSVKLSGTTEFMKLAEARVFLGEREVQSERTDLAQRRSKGAPLLRQMRRHQRFVIIGTPGSGKSTFLEWLQLKLAAVEEEFVMAGQQAIPLLLRMRQLDAHDLPHGAELIAKATESKDRAALMPLGWVERHMHEGRVLFMLDGLDETEPGLRDDYILPWLANLCQTYPKCRYVISSRPVGYPPRTLRALRFAECTLLDFEASQISEYTRHWCTAVRLARNEPEEEARREGAMDGEHIAESFKHHPYISNLARNPLMLSAICLVKYFERGDLPQDRALLYKLCVEGLLHHWDQRRGIHSEFGLEEKLRTCRNVALAMQADDRAEYEADKVQAIFTGVLGDPTRAEKLLEHIRYRTGLLLERRPGVFAFAHLTFQEYLAAQAIHEGNQLGIDVARLAQEHHDGRWQEVIALYCGLASTPAARNMIEGLIAQSDTLELATMLAEAYLAAGAKLAQEGALRKRVLKRIALSPVHREKGFNLARFPADEVTPLAYACIDSSEGRYPGEAYRWLLDVHPDALDVAFLVERLQRWRTMEPQRASISIALLHARGPSWVLAEMATDADMYAAPGPEYASGVSYGSQAEVALIGLAMREEDRLRAPEVETVLLQALRVILGSERTSFCDDFLVSFRVLLSKAHEINFPQNATIRLECASLACQLAERFAKIKDCSGLEPVIRALNAWADALDRTRAHGLTQ